MAVQRPTYHATQYIPRQRGAAASAISQIAQSFESEYKQKRAEGGAVEALLEEARLNSVLADGQTQRENGFLDPKQAAQDYAKVERVLSREDIPLEAKEKYVTDWKANCIKRAEAIKKGTREEAITGESDVLGRLQQRPQATESIIEDTLDKIGQQNERERQDELRMTGPESRTGFKPGVEYATLPSEQSALGGIPATEGAPAGFPNDGSVQRAKAIFEGERANPASVAESQEWDRQEIEARKRIRAGMDPLEAYNQGLTQMQTWKESRHGETVAAQRQSDKLANDLEKAKLAAASRVAAAKGRAKESGRGDLLAAAAKLEGLVKENAALQQRYLQAKSDMKTMVASQLSAKYGSEDPVALMEPEITGLTARMAEEQRIADELYAQAGYAPKRSAAPAGNSLGLTPPKK